MINILKIYPDAIIQETPILDDQHLCYYDQETGNYIAIEKTSLTEKEKLLLDEILQSIDSSPALLNHTTSQTLWYEFLTASGAVPDNKEARLRFIHFHIDRDMNKGDFLEATQYFLQDHMILIWIDQSYGIMIENETSDPLSSSDFLSFTEALLADFYMPVNFYIGRFYERNSLLKRHFKREQEYFKIVHPISPKEHIFSFENSFPFVMMSTKGDQLLSILETECVELFQHDFELLSTIKLYLESNSNTSLTAKKLYLHRNSLQYRIDKFIERTSIDIKGFQGAMSVYFICLYGERMNIFGKFDEKVK